LIVVVLSLYSRPHRINLLLLEKGVRVGLGVRRKEKYWVYSLPLPVGSEAIHYVFSAAHSFFKNQASLREFGSKEIYSSK
jgi:hypothetical protein